MPSAPKAQILFVAALACGALAFAPSAAAASCKNADALPGEASKKALVSSTLCLLNAERRQKGLRKLKLSSRLSKAARGHARDMARNNYFSHTSRNGASFLDRIKKTGYLRKARSWMAGENLAWGSGRLSTPRSTVRAWMKSSGHRANILTGRFEHLGIGIVFDAPENVGSSKAATYATDFGYKS